MSPKVELNDLVDAQEVADLVGLTHRNSVSTYLKRYADFPRPVLERSNGRTRLWNRPDVDAWVLAHRTRGRDPI